MQTLVRWGMPNAEALAAGTIRAAEVCRIEGKTGSLVAGKAADLITLAGNPLENIDAVTQARLIFKDGVRQDKLDA